MMLSTRRVEWVTFALEHLRRSGQPHRQLRRLVTPTDLFISEYIEGSSFNKAIEIYNGTGGAVDLAAGLYTLELYSNGSARSANRWPFPGRIADGDVYVLAHPSADAAILAEADITNGSVINFNGDDAVVLRKDGVGGRCVWTDWS